MKRMFETFFHPSVDQEEVQRCGCVLSPSSQQLKKEDAHVKEEAETSTTSRWDFFFKKILLKQPFNAAMSKYLIFRRQRFFNK